MEYLDKINIKMFEKLMLKSGLEINSSPYFILKYDYKITTDML